MAGQSISGKEGVCPFKLYPISPLTAPTSPCADQPVAIVDPRPEERRQLLVEYMNVFTAISHHLMLYSHSFLHRHNHEGAVITLVVSTEEASSDTFHHKFDLMRLLTRAQALTAQG